MGKVLRIVGEAQLRDSACACAGLPRLLHAHAGAGDRLGAYVLADGAGTGGLLPYVVQSYGLPCRVGDLSLFTAPLRRLQLLHGAGNWPESRPACDALLEYLAETVGRRSHNGNGLSSVDVVCATAVPVDSALAQAIMSRGGAARRFRIYRPAAPVRHHRIRLPATFDAYLEVMSAKSRNGLRRKVRRLLGDAVSEAGYGADLIEARSVGPDSTGLVRITASEDVPWLVQRMSEISRKTYQYNLLGLGVRDADRLSREAGSAAEQGWLRSYILMNKGRAVAFLYGMQFPADASHLSGETCHYLDVGHDPAWSELSPGTVLQFLVIRDLWEYRRPELFDFGPGHAVHKERFGNESYLEVDLYLFCPTGRALWAHGAHATCTGASNMAGRVLNNLGLKNWIRGAVRRLGSVAVSGASTPGS